MTSWLNPVPSGGVLPLENWLRPETANCHSCCWQRPEKPSSSAGALKHRSAKRRGREIRVRGYCNKKYFWILCHSKTGVQKSPFLYGIKLLKILCKTRHSNVPTWQRGGFCQSQLKNNPAWFPAATLSAHVFAVEMFSLTFVQQINVSVRSWGPKKGRFCISKPSNTQPQNTQCIIKIFRFVYVYLHIHFCKC